LCAILSLVYHKPVFGLSGWALVDASLFVVVAWRITKMSRAWAVLGLLIYLVEVGFGLATNGAVGILSVIFVLTYIGAIRGTFAFHRYNRITNAAPTFSR